MFASSSSSKTLLTDSPKQTSKSVRINDKAQDLEQVHAARVTRQLRRMKRKLLLDAMADDPTNAGFPTAAGGASSSSANRTLG